nr:BspA family leucine-rich repeat surface protein [Mycoplasmopsis bovis]
MGIENWDTSNISNLSETFSYAENFQSRLIKMKNSNVTDMSVTFYNAKKFNSPLNNWDTYNVTNMQSMFYGACMNSINNNIKLKNIAMLQICHLCSNVYASKIWQKYKWNEMSKKLLTIIIFATILGLKCKLKEPECKLENCPYVLLLKKIINAKYAKNLMSMK